MLQLRLLILAMAVLAVGVIISMGLQLGGSQPASADDVEVTAQEFLTTYCGSSIPTDTEVEIEDGTNGSTPAATGCSVTLNADSELEFGKNVILTVNGTFTLDGSGAADVEIQFGEGNTVTTGPIVWKVGEDGEIQVKKNSTITASGDVLMEASGEDGEIQLEENTELHASSKIELKASGDDGEIQIKKVDSPPAGFSSPNITATGDIIMSASGDDGEVQVEEGNSLDAEGKIELKADGTDGEVQTKKNVTLAADDDINLFAKGDDGEVQTEESNTIIAGSGKSITIESGDGGETEVKDSGTTITTGTGPAFSGSVTVKTGSGGECELDQAAVTINSANQTICT